MQDNDRATAMITATEDSQPRLLGFCIGIPGQACGKRITTDDLMAVVIPGRGPIGDCCQSKLFSAVAWSNQLEASSHSAKGSQGNFQLLGTPKFTTPKSHPRLRNSEPKKRRKYSKRRQPWNMEKP